VKAIYSGELGWFDGKAEDLYPVPYDEESSKTLLLMGGASKVLKAVEDAQAMNDHRWALRLIKIIKGARKDKSGAWVGWGERSGVWVGVRIGH
jgi:alkyl sulfatase BDS1-like metallo-beta-lactamase superfamily hydrolase